MFLLLIVFTLMEARAFAGHASTDPSHDVNGLAHVIYPYRQNNRVYMAGPLFSESERHEMAQLAEVLERAGFETFLPHRDGLEFAKIAPYMIDVLGYDSVQVSRWMTRVIDALDVYQVIIANGLMVMNLNGRVPDEGAVAELAIAWSFGKPIIIYRNDARSLIDGIHNPLVMGRGEFVEIVDMEQIPEALRRRAKELAIQPNDKVIARPNVQEKITEGETIWRVVSTLRADGASSEEFKEQLARAIAFLYGEQSQCAALFARGH